MVTAILDFQKPYFWARGPLGLSIFHHYTKFGAKMLIDAKIMAKNLISEHWDPSGCLFPSLYQIWCKNFDRRRNYGRKSKSTILDFRKSDFWELEPLRLPIFHLGTKFGAKMLINHPRWRSDMWSCMLGGLREVVISFKFRQNRMNRFRDVVGRNLPFPILKANGLYNSLWWKIPKCSNMVQRMI